MYARSLARAPEAALIPGIMNAWPAATTLATTCSISSSLPAK
jgi:hypothetical protein